MLECRSCGRTYESGPEEPWRCECGHALDFAEQPLPDSDEPDVDPREGLWAFDEFLPIGAEVTLGEGWTPLADAPEWDAQFKLDYVFPSGSYKDRGAALTLSRAAELGVERIVEDSSGNAGAAIAQYAARAGIDADIYVPASVKQSKLDAIEAAGATAVRIEGSRQDVTDACIQEAVGGDAWYASHAWNPAFYAGTSTFALELAAQRDWTVPDTVVLPLGHGTLFIGAYRGFSALEAAGWTESVPRLLGVQAMGVAPIVEELHGSEEAGTNDVADGIQIREPARKGQILDAIDATDGDAIACDAEVTEDALDALHERGFYVEPTSAVGVAGLEAYRERGVLDADADVVVALTGSGLKK
ncbi:MULTISPECIES: pyridoxal-phosphate dependent enzyme [unclassified Halobacterium]|jgi:threonine synthase|uniref:pyridoxal-phosphate dependent enzyme n=1 Tax=unclassified Halobacterium TaxID=2668073 RepID=UPI001E441B94|nr:MULTISPECIES: pyridoxal-phosphate dependent enzyme [unclassified Halobacterium]MCD2198862.1 pyridoxal-phosphate dependent enzyme [Halobacterium sp. KA-4]MCD2202878.1 pyridoxal-phosphate dependent enzyme [Halobacterium sp. KA-6]